MNHLMLIQKEEVEQDTETSKELWQGTKCKTAFDDMFDEFNMTCKKYIKVVRTTIFRPKIFLQY